MSRTGSRSGTFETAKICREVFVLLIFCNKAGALLGETLERKGVIAFALDWTEKNAAEKFEHNLDVEERGGF